jgi:threonine synthase
MSPTPLLLRCQGCGREVPLDAPAPYACPASGDGGDHVLAAPAQATPDLPDEPAEPNPFVRYRARFSSYALARSRGLTDAGYVELVRALDAEVARVDGAGFRETLFTRSEPLSTALRLEAGGVWVKDETGNVAGSHKARHLMGLALFAAVQLRAGLAQGSKPLAIASCGNAALAAAVVAKAWGRALDVFIPTDANPRVVERLRALGAKILVCPRQPGVAGDPCYHAFKRAIAEGALPFCCQGPDDGLTIEGGRTLAYELASATRRQRVRLDRLFVQVGGGALASAVWQGLREELPTSVLPRLHPVQTQGAFPLYRAWRRVAAELAALCSVPCPAPAATRAAAPDGAQACEDAALAEALRKALTLPQHAGALERALVSAAARRAQFMWPWEEAPHSVAHGILDDETYDWLQIVRGTLESGGFPLVVSEALLGEAHALGRRAGFHADPTGTAGLAGLLLLSQAGLAGAGDAAAVLLTGAER